MQQRRSIISQFSHQLGLICVVLGEGKGLLRFITSIRAESDFNLGVWRCFEEGLCYVSQTDLVSYLIGRGFCNILFLNILSFTTSDFFSP